MRIHAQASESSFNQLAEQMWQMLLRMEDQHYFCSHAPDRWTPRLNLYETATCFIVCVELAGMKRESIDLRADHGVLHIQGTRPKPGVMEVDPDCEDIEHVGVHVMEIDSGPFHRKVPIPSDVDVDAIAAVYRHGYLWITLPRKKASGS